MNTLSSMIASLPDCYRDGSFDILVRDAASVAVFWDLSSAAASPRGSDGLCLSITCGDETEMLHLNGPAGHLLAPVLGDSRVVEITLGWKDGRIIRPIATREVKLPALAEDLPLSGGPVPFRASTPAFGYHAARARALSGPVERQGFRPPSATETASAA